MKTKTAAPFVPSEPLDDAIKDYAYHLYEQSGCASGHDLDNWLEAKACLLANIPRPQVQGRLRHHLEQSAAAAR